MRELYLAKVTKGRLYRHKSTRQINRVKEDKRKKENEKKEIVRMLRIDMHSQYVYIDQTSLDLWPDTKLNQARRSETERKREREQKRPKDLLAHIFSSWFWHLSNGFCSTRAVFYTSRRRKPMLSTILASTCAMPYFHRSWKSLLAFV